MRVSWINGRRLVALAATVMVLQGTGDAVAQFAPLGNQSQPSSQNQVYNPKQVYPQNREFSENLQKIYTQNPTYPSTKLQPQYTAMAFQADGSPAVAPTPEATVPAPAASYGGIEQGGVATGGYGYGNGYGYNSFANSCCYGSCGHRGSGCGCGSRYGCGSPSGCGRRWFGGIYGLFMERDNADCVPLAFSTSTGNAPPYYPTDAETALTTSNVDIGFQSGLELRIGSTFGLGGAVGGFGGCDSCGAGSCGGTSCCGPTHAWEAVYWGLFEESETNQIYDLTTDANRLYGMIDFRGLEYDTGAGWRSMNHYYDYGPPTADNTVGPTYDIEVRSFTARSTFSLQNVELNLLRLPVLGGCGGCNQPRYELTTLVGARFMRFDENFMFRTDFERMDTNALGYIGYNSEAKNNLYGFQMGCNGSYRLGCRGCWALHCNTSLGLYGNHIEVRQWANNVRFVNGTQSNFDVESDKDDVSMVGEIRLGASYQYSCNWRFFTGWRLLGVSGVALSTDQIPGAFITPDQVGKVASNGSMLVHGLQTGVECTY